MCNDRGSEVPLSALCKLETQQSHWCGAVSAHRPETQGADGVSSGEDQCVSSADREVTFSPRFVLSGPKGLDGAHPHGEGPLHLLPVQMLISCRNVLPNYPKHVWPNSWVTWDPVRSTQVVHRINHHTHFVDWGYLFIVELSEIFIYSRYKFLTDTCLHFRNKHF